MRTTPRFPGQEESQVRECLSDVAEVIHVSFAVISTSLLILEGGGVTVDRRTKNTNNCPPEPSASPLQGNDGKNLSHQLNSA